MQPCMMSTAHIVDQLGVTALKMRSRLRGPVDMNIGAVGKPSLLRLSQEFFWPYR